MKGIELPISVLVIVVVAAIVLLSVVGLFYGSWFNISGVISLEAVKSSSCKRLLGNCRNDVNFVVIDNFDADKDGSLDPGIAIDGCMEKGGTSQDNLYMLCKCHYSADEEQCRDICMCGMVMTDSEEMPPDSPPMTLPSDMP
ncbi:MAG: hypothetical protein V1818_04130 [Candidatus Aenigmatarchaeota archaeon]